MTIPPETRQYGRNTEWIHLTEEAKNNVLRGEGDAYLIHSLQEDDKRNK